MQLFLGLTGRTYHFIPFNPNAALYRVRGTDLDDKVKGTDLDESAHI